MQESDVFHAAIFAENALRQPANAQNASKDSESWTEIAWHASIRAALAPKVQNTSNCITPRIL